MDPFSEVLAMLGLQVAVPYRFEASGRWAIRFDSCRHLKVGAALARFSIRPAVVDVPARLAQEPLHVVRGHFASLLSQRPSVLPLQTCDWTVGNAPRDLVLIGGRIYVGDEGLGSLLPGQVPMPRAPPMTSTELPSERITRLGRGLPSVISAARS